ncbi:MAG: DUF3365 domain-containing protein [Granulosicoccaceae bacterium]|jgi:protein-histidine pros-kinase
MKLTTKFNLVLLSVFTIGLIVVGYVSHYVLQNNARQEVIRHAGMMMEAALAMRSYTIKEIRPLLKDGMQQQFLPQSVPSYAATQNFEALRESRPDYHYKEATLNPTNPRDRATDWETDIINAFRDSGELPELVGERNTPNGRSLYLARPIRIKNESCLACHSTLDKAPASMIKLYGEANGFGWQFGEVVGSQIVSVPLSLPIEKANQAFIIFMGSMLATFALIFLLLNIMLRKVVIKPILKISHIADEASKGNTDIAEFNIKAKDEISDLARAFNRMRISLEKAMKMLS